LAQLLLSENCERDPQREKNIQFAQGERHVSRLVRVEQFFFAPGLCVKGLKKEVPSSGGWHAEKIKGKGCGVSEFYGSVETLAAFMRGVTITLVVLLLSSMDTDSTLTKL